MKSRYCFECKVYECSCIKKRSRDWFKAREKNLRQQIAETRKKIALWKKMGAKDNEQAARREMISLKSKLADTKKAR